MKKMFSKNGQSLTEIVLLIGVVSLVFIGMEVYFKRGVSGKIKDLTDNWIGRKQETFQQDTSGLAINESSSNSIFDAKTTITEGAGGTRTLKSDEKSTVSYSSETND